MVLNFLIFLRSKVSFYFFRNTLSGHINWVFKTNEYFS